MMVFISHQLAQSKSSSVSVRRTETEKQSFGFWLEREAQKSVSLSSDLKKSLHISMAPPLKSEHPVLSTSPVSFHYSERVAKITPEVLPAVSPQPSETLPGVSSEGTTEHQISGLLLIQPLLPSAEQEQNLVPGERSASEAFDSSLNQNDLLWARLAYQALMRQQNPVGFQPNEVPTFPALQFSATDFENNSWAPQSGAESKVFSFNKGIHFFTPVNHDAAQEFELSFGNAYSLSVDMPMGSQGLEHLRFFIALLPSVSRQGQFIARPERVHTVEDAQEFNVSEKTDMQLQSAAPAVPEASAPAAPVAHAPAAPAVPEAHAPAAPAVPEAPAPATPAGPEASAPATPAGPEASAPAAPAVPEAHAPAASVSDAPVREVVLGNARIRMFILGEQTSRPGFKTSAAETSEKAPVYANLDDFFQALPYAPVQPLKEEPGTRAVAEPQDQVLAWVVAGVRSSFLNLNLSSGMASGESSQQKSFQGASSSQAALLFPNFPTREISVPAIEKAEISKLSAFVSEKPWWLEMVSEMMPETSVEAANVLGLLTENDSVLPEQDSGLPWEQVLPSLFQASQPSVLAPKGNEPIHFSSVAAPSPLMVFAASSFDAESPEGTVLSGSSPAIDAASENSEPGSLKEKPSETLSFVSFVSEFRRPEFSSEKFKALPKATKISFSSQAGFTPLGNAELEKGVSSAPASFSEVLNNEAGMEMGLAKPEIEMKVTSAPKPQLPESLQKVESQGSENSAEKYSGPKQSSPVPLQAMNAQTAIQMINQGVPIQISDFPAFVNQVVQTQNFKTGVLQSIEINLFPQNLGKVSAQFTLNTQSEMVVRLYAPNAVAAKTLETYIQEIQQMIQKSYLVAGQIEVKQGIPPARGSQGSNTSGQSTDLNSRQSLRKGGGRRRRKDDDLSVDVSV